MKKLSRKSKEKVQPDAAELFAARMKEVAAQKEKEPGQPMIFTDGDRRSRFPTLKEALRRYSVSELETMRANWKTMLLRVLLYQKVKLFKFYSFLWAVCFVFSLIWSIDCYPVFRCSRVKAPCLLDFDSKVCPTFFL